MSRRDDKARTVRYQFSIITVVCTGTYALFQRTGSQSSQCNGRIGNCNPSFTRSGNGRHSNLRGYNGVKRSRVADDSRHSNLRGYNGIERSRVADDGRHSNLRGCNRGHVSIARRIQIRKDRNRLTHNCAARSGKRFPCCRIGLQCFDCGVAAPHSSHCYRRFNNSRHSNLRSCYRRHSNLMRRKHSSFGVLVCIINIPKSERGITT